MSVSLRSLPASASNRKPYGSGVTAVGLTAQQSEGGLAAARDTLLGTIIDFSAAAYRQTGGIKLQPGPAGSRDSAEEPTLFLDIDTYRVPVSPPA